MKKNCHTTLEPKAKGKLKAETLSTPHKVGKCPHCKKTVNLAVWTMMQELAQLGYTVTLRVKRTPRGKALVDGPDLGL